MTRVSVNVVNNLPFECSKSAIAAYVLVSGQNSASKFPPHLGIDLVLDDHAGTGFSVKHNVGVRVSPGLRRRELRK